MLFDLFNVRIKLLRQHLNIVSFMLMLFLIIIYLLSLLQRLLSRLLLIIFITASHLNVVIYSTVIAFCVDFASQLELRWSGKTFLLSSLDWSSLFLHLGRTCCCKFLTLQIAGWGTRDTWFDRWFLLFQWLRLIFIICITIARQLSGNALILHHLWLCLA